MGGCLFCFVDRFYITLFSAHEQTQKLSETSKMFSDFFCDNLQMSSKGFTMAPTILLFSAFEQTP